MGVIRLLLALSVAVVHSRPILGLPFTVMVGGKNAVQMFYCISGFYMALILNTKYVGPGSYRVFIKSRYFRIFPAYAVVALVTLLAGFGIWAAMGKLIPLFHTWARYGSSLTPGAFGYLVFTNLAILGQDISMFFRIRPETGALAYFGGVWKEPMAQDFLVVPQAWTVGTELWFYLLAPFFVRSIPRIAALIVAGLMLRLVLFRLIGPNTMSWDYRFFPTELPLFLAGALGFHAYTALQSRQVNLKGIGRVTFVGMLVLILAFYKLPWKWLPSPRSSLQLDLIVLIFPLTLPFIFALTKRNHVDRLIGELSYPVYLVHWIVIDLLRILGGAWVDRNLGAVTCVVTLAAAGLLWYFIDRPIDNWRQSFVTERRAAKQPAVAVGH